jgi:hypothetical protein
MSLASIQTAVTDLVRDRDGIISEPQRDAAITVAVNAYSLDRPRAVVVDVPGNGGSRIDLPQGFTEDSRLIAIEYPIGQEPPAELPASEISFYAAPDKRQLALPVAIASGERARVTYTATHVLDEDEDTLPAAHAHALACLAASILCGQLSSYYASESEPTISADTVNRQTKSATWRQRQRDLAAEYGRTVGAAPNPRKQAAIATRDLERGTALGGSRLFHPTRTWPS